MTLEEPSKNMCLPDTNWYIFGFQYIQNNFKNSFDEDYIKALKANKIYQYFLTNSKKIIINQKVLEEIKKICNKKNLYYDEPFIKKIAFNFPGIKYTVEDLVMIKNWSIKITNPEQRFNSADMLIYVLCHRANVDIIITDDIGDFDVCADIYKQYFPNAKDIKILNLDQAIKYLEINN